MSEPLPQRAGALEEGGEVGVHVAGIAASAGRLLAGRRDLSQRVAVVGDVAQHDQHVHAAFEGQVLTGGERHTGSQEAFDGRIAGPVDVEDAALHSLAGCQLIGEQPRLAVGDADGREDHGEGHIALDPRPLHDPRCQIEAGQTRAGEHRQLLATHQRVHPVDGGEAGLDEVGQLSPARRIDRGSVERTPCLADRDGQAVEGPPGAGQGAPQQLATHRRAGQLPAQGDAYVGRGDAQRLLENLHHRHLAPHFDHLPATRWLAGHLDGGPLAQHGTLRVAHVEERSRHGASPPVDARKLRHASASRADTPSIASWRSRSK